MEAMDSWQLVQAGQFEEAVETANKELTLKNEDPIALRHKTYALLHLKRYAEAEQSARQIIAITKGNNDFDFIFLGTSLWAQNRQQEAIAAWQKGRKTVYTDASGGMEMKLILYFAGIKTNDEKLKATAKKDIKNLLKNKRAVNWPGPLGNYLFDEISDEELFSFITDIPILRERHISQAYFVLVIKALEAMDKDGYVSKLKDVIGLGRNAYLEQVFYLAKVELENQ